MSSVEFESYVVTTKEFEGFLLFFFFYLSLADLDDNEKNEKLKFSIVTRLPEVTLDVSSWNLEVGMKFLPVHRIQSTENLAVAHIGHRKSLNIQSFSICCS